MLRILAPGAPWYDYHTCARNRCGYGATTQTDHPPFPRDSHPASFLFSTVYACMTEILAIGRGFAELGVGPQLCLERP